MILEDSTKKELLKKAKLFFLEMNAIQQRFIHVKNKSGYTPRRRLNECGNKGGKTHGGIAEDLAHAWGCRIWLPEDHPDYKIQIKVPNRGLIGCETMAHSVMEKIWPTLEELIPLTCSYKTKKNPQGQIQKLTFETDPFGQKCTSEIYLRSYDQEPATFEGIDADWIHWDEPPPKKIIEAAERGKIVSNAPSWFTMTPLKEAYIYDEYSLKAANMGGDDEEIAVVRGEIWENCIDYCFYCDLDIPENRIKDEEFNLIRPVKNCPQCDRVLGFIEKAGIDDYLKTLDPETRESREKGLWKHLSGLIYKDLDRDIHLYDDIPIPKHWMMIEGMDPHDARPSKYLFAAVSPEEIDIFKKTRNRIYVFDYLLLDGDMDSIVRKIKMKRAEYGYSKPKWIVLDSKYGTRTEMEGKSWEDELRLRGIGHIRLSKSRPGDVELGHKLVREYLKLHHSTLTDRTKPGILLAKEKCKGAGGPINQLFNYQYSDKHDKPKEEYKDFPDVLRYMVLEEPIYMNPILQKEREKKIYEIRDHAYRLRRHAI